MVEGYPSYARKVKADGARAHWRLDDTGTTAKDEIGSAVGALIGGVTTGVPGGVQGGTAMTFNGTTSYILVSGGAPHPGDVFSFEVWLKTIYSAANHVIYQDNTDHAFGVIMNAAGKIVVDDWAGTPIGTTIASYNDGAWHHFVWTKNGAANRMYVDGADITPAITNLTLIPGTADVQISPFTLPFNGSLDEVAIYGYALTPAQVLAHYRIGLVSGKILSNVPVAEQEVTWNRDGVQYAGRIRSVDPVERFTAGDWMRLRLDCQDLTTLLDLDICAPSDSPPQISGYRPVVETDAQRIQWLLNSFGKQGVTTRHVQTNYATVPVVDYTGKTLREAIKSVLAYSGGSFYVDNARDLHCFTDEKQYAPFSLTETPNNTTSFPFADLDIPSDSLELINAVRFTPAVGLAPTTADSGTVQITGAGTPVVLASVMVATFSGVAGRKPGLVQLGEFVSGTNLRVEPKFQRPTTAGDCLVCWLISDNNDAATTAPGWKFAGGSFQPQGQIWYKPNCGDNEAPPVFTSNSTFAMRAQLGEFSDVNGREAFAFENTNANNPKTVVNGAVDLATADLILMSCWWNMTSAATATFSESFNSAALPAVHVGDAGSTVTNRQASFSYAIRSGIVPKWYESAASIAAYGRKEKAVEAPPEIVTQADLDALGAAYLTNNAFPRQQGSFVTRQAGLLPGHRFTILSSLFDVPINLDPLGDYSGIVQSIAASWPEDEQGGLKIAVEFLEPTIDLSVQVGEILTRIATSAVSPLPQTLRITTSDTPASTTGNVMCGLGDTPGTWRFTPRLSGKVLVVITGNLHCTVANDRPQLSATYGTGTPPINGAAPTGTSFGTQVDPLLIPAANERLPFTISDILDLTVGTEYWFDLNQRRVTGTGAVAVVYPKIFIVEFPT